jgi:hypothetical protein
VTDKIYIHEFIDIIGPNRARYMHHMTANWVPIAIEERHQFCFGVWGTVGSTGRWPEVVNMWELDGWEGLADNFDHELSHGSLQDPSLAEWWKTASELRRGGTDRILVPSTSTRSIDQLLSDGVHGAVYAHELITVAPCRSTDVLELIELDGRETVGQLGVQLVGAFDVAMVHGTEVIVIWAFPDWATWIRYERAWAIGGEFSQWNKSLRAHQAVVRRSLMMDAPLSPMRIGRQPSVEDRRPLSEL